MATGLTAGAQLIPSEAVAQTDREAQVDAWLEQMTPATKAAQLFTVSIAGTTLTEEETAWLTELQPGGVILVESNIGTDIRYPVAGTSLDAIEERLRPD